MEDENIKLLHHLTLYSTNAATGDTRTEHTNGSRTTTIPMASWDGNTQNDRDLGNPLIFVWWLRWFQCNNQNTTEL